MTVPSPEVHTLKPATGFVVMMVCFGVPFIGFGLLVAWLTLSAESWIDGLYSMPIVGLGLFLVFEATTLRLHASQERVWLSRFWHIRWWVRRECVELREGLVGDIPFVPGLIVFDRCSDERVGEIIIHQFSATALAQWRADLRR